MERSSRLRIGVIVDRNMLAQWQADALRSLPTDIDLFVYSCSNRSPASRRPANYLYYLLNLVTIRNPLTRLAPWPADLKAIAVREFSARQDGGWQQLPAESLVQLREDGIDVIVKFGMGLLQIPTETDLSVPILSYHHGDPARFRGRPAGFYELQAGEPVMGQVVQRLSNRLDAGEIVAMAETKTAPHSYRSTLIEAYRHSPLILGRAIANCLEGRGRVPDRWGRIYRLPPNSAALRFVLKRWIALLTRLFYGLFKEKRWNVATAAIGDRKSLESILRAISRPADWRTRPVPKGYRFLADPFFDPEQGLLVEGLNAQTGLGEILHVGDDLVRRVSGRGGHYSYPAACFDGARWHVIPEISEWSVAKTFELHDAQVADPVELRLPGRPRLLDPTPFWHDGQLYLFANIADEGPSVLRLWTAGDLTEEFTEHPSSPVRLSPQGSRMAGGIFHCDAGLVRVGQDLRREYGDGLTFFRINHIDRDRYQEVILRDFRFDHCKGPHTLNLKDGQAAFDFYDERFSLFAGIRRWKERQAARRAT